ncbi:hypothetical protein [Streptomyces pseudogriseolus]|uniref:hypothetical protein n=1 Tax=Streptomyces pseudogriseolus TaxID=36817 RepID=UPI003FA1E2D6
MMKILAQRPLPGVEALTQDKVARLERENAQLRRAIDAHAAVDQALGVLLAVYRVTPSIGFEVLGVPGSVGQTLRGGAVTGRSLCVTFRADAVTGEIRTVTTRSQLALCRTNMTNEKILQAGFQQDGSRRLV